jgi:hypothetical protein
MKMITEISEDKTENNSNKIDGNRLNMILEQAMSAIGKNDMILLADIFTFDLKPLLMAGRETNDELL